MLHIHVQLHKHLRPMIEARRISEARALARRLCCAIRRAGLGLGSLR
jgi:hypothetical protein